MSDFYYACEGLSLKIYSSKPTATHTHTHAHLSVLLLHIHKKWEISILICYIISCNTALGNACSA